MPAATCFEIAVAERSSRIQPDVALKANKLLSMETQDDLTALSLRTFVTDHPAVFLQAVRRMPEDAQDRLLPYLFLGTKQAVLAQILGTNQSQISEAISRDITVLGAKLLLPTLQPDATAPILRRTGWETRLGPPLSEVIAIYADVRRLDRVARHFRLPRRNVRRAVLDCANELERSTDVHARALGILIKDLIRRSRAQHATEPEKQTTVVRTPAILGQFRIDVTDPDFASVFSPKSDA